MIDRRIRHYGEDSPFGSWLRERNKDGTIPSTSLEFGVTANDVDMVINRWKCKPTGTRVNSILMVEIKTRGGELSYSQECLSSLMSCFAAARNFPNCQVRFYGCASLIMSGTSPDNSDWMQWRRFPVLIKQSKTKVFVKRDWLVDQITKSQLIDLLRFDLHPISLRKCSIEQVKHGKTRIERTVKTPLGFDVDEIIWKQY